MASSYRWIDGYSPYKTLVHAIHNYNVMDGTLGPRDVSIYCTMLAVIFTYFEETQNES